MARRRSRYARLLRDLKTTDGSPTPGSDLAKFVDFLTGKTKLTVNNKLPEGAKNRYNVAVIPFGLSATSDVPDQRYKVPISKYSYAGLKGRSGLAIADFGISFIQEGNRNDAEYFPALIKPSYSSTTGSNANKVSAVTGRTYDYNRTRTFSIPFGRTVTAVDAKSKAPETAIDNVDEVDVLKTLRSKMNGQTDANQNPVSISYDPEVFRPLGTVTDATSDASIPTAGIVVD